MNEIRKTLEEAFKSAAASPFLFVGSGFSRRYLGLEDWGSLLRRFAAGLKDYEFYLSSANAELPQVATLIAEDFHGHWWSAPEYSASRQKNKSRIKDRTTALRIEICAYINSLAFPKFSESVYSREIEVLSRLNVDGIITTNWDGLLEHFFPDYRVFVGQSELLFSNPQSIAEIYKIHGSCSKPGSLVLTKADYELFERQNPYLAAKLITVFVEHPIVFVGYSLSDKNISSLLRSIVNCIGSENLEKLRRNLIFVQRASGATESIAQTFVSIEGVQLPVTLVKTDDFVPVYEAIETVRRKIPARVLRLCKEQLYELVKAPEASEKLSVLNIDDISEKEDVEFVVGFGVAKNHSPAEIGYQGLTAADLFKDVVADASTLDPEQVLASTIPALLKHCKYLPCHRYLASREGGRGTAELAESLTVLLDRKAEDFITKSYAKQFVRYGKDKTAVEIIAENTPEKAAILLPFLSEDKFELDTVKAFLRENLSKVETQTSNYASFFRKLAALYDYHKYRK